ncbi:hybrid sensor histidine kinase/response regulator [Paraburkholderia bannensis]|uniref:hybrid sensor histidine kinase/response regulator n=1 Tax=Paraburkholderia bannensis TaxID=765414 RepID=UPI002AB0AF9C|nr:ATP-binding protein [Paraburkholderia bannensis]
MLPAPAKYSLTDIHTRPAREPDWRAQSRALLGLAALQPESREALLAGVANAALSLCCAASAGISLPEVAGGSPVFRWHAIAGRLAALQGQAVPADDCPCAFTLDGGKPLLFTSLLDDFPALAPSCAGVQEALIVPVIRDGHNVAALWVASMDDTCRFGPEDERVLLELAQVAGASLEMAGARDFSRRETQRYSEVIAVLAHEFRNPLGPLENAIDGLRRLTSAQSAQWPLLNVAQRQVLHLKRLMDELQDAARLDHDKLGLNLSEVRLDDVIADALASVQERVKAHRHTLTVNGSSDDIRFVGDQVRLVQVVANLLSNAVRYTPDGGRVELSIAHSQHEGRARLEIAVRDNGIGIDAAALPRLFEPFSQFSSARPRQEGGFGIGLSISRKLAELHGGTLTVTSEGAGKGTTARLSLPLQTADAALALPVARCATAAPAQILIVDDSEDARFALATLLDMDGHYVKTANSGESALRIFESWTPDLALVDLGMPGMDGLELAQRLRTHPSRAGFKLVALTGRVSEQEQRAALDAGFDAHLAKPVDMEQVRGMLPARAD